LDDALWYGGIALPCATSFADVSRDTIYACQDIKDDVKVGVRSTAILFGSWIFPLLMLCGITFVAMLAVTGYLNGQGYAYFIISVGGAAAHVVWQFTTVDLDVPLSCWREFPIIYNQC
jgi:4-hydroxybenzoate polyprenyltransferase